MNEETTLVEISLEDIHQGKPRNAGLCPAAIASNRKVKNGKVYFCLYYALYVTPEGSLFSSIEPKVRTFIERFDAGKKVEPVFFNLNWKKKENFDA